MSTEAAEPKKKSLLQYKEPEPAAAKPAKGAKKGTNIQEVLDAILPPKEFITEAGVKLEQHVSPMMCPREDVISLQLDLDTELQSRQAREYDICPVREQLYSECFDELIRMITVECPERGLLLLRVRDEVRMTIAAYRTLYSSSITFGMRKTLQAEQGNAELCSKIEELKAEKERLSSLLQDRRGQLDSIEKRNAEKKQTTDRRMGEEKDFQDHQTAQLEKFIADSNK